MVQALKEALQCFLGGAQRSAHLERFQLNAAQAATGPAVEGGHMRSFSTPPARQDSGGVGERKELLVDVDCHSESREVTLTCDNWLSSAKGCELRGESFWNNFPYSRMPTRCVWLRRESVD